MGSVLIADKINEDAIEFLQRAGHTVESAFDITPEQLLEKIPTVDALMVRSRTKVTRDVIQKATQLKVIARAGVGVDTIDVEAAKEHGIAVVNAPGSNSEAVAEHTIALLLALTRHIVPTVNAMNQGRWEKKTYEGMEVSGKTLGIIGLGHIGARVAEIGSALGMKIVVSTRTQSEEKKKKLAGLGGSFVSLDALLKNSDIVTVHVPATDETKKLLDAHSFSAMKPTALFINTARGSVVDEEALLAALKEKKIAGAALDVFATEPVAIEHLQQLAEIPHLILTPHIASMSPESKQRASMMIATDVDNVLKGQKPLYSV